MPWKDKTGSSRRFIEKDKRSLKHQRVGDPLVVVTGRPYNLYDERLNLRLGQNLAKIGMSALPMDFVDVSAVDLSDFSSMYWGLGAQILRTAKFIRDRPNTFRPSFDQFRVWGGFLY